MKLYEPRRITSSVRISFRGEGTARFRLQHAADRDGEPDDLTWCDVSDLAGIENANAAAANNVVRTMLVDTVHGDVDLTYHRYRADWLRVVPHDDEETERCSRFSLAVQPIPGES